MRRLAPLLLVAGIAAACADPYRPPAGDLDPPTVTGSTPPAGAADVGRRPELRVEFSEPIDPATVDGSSIVLFAPSARIDGEVRAEERAAVFVPTADLREGTDFRLVVRRGVRDLAGVPLSGDEGPGTDATIPFRTAAVPPEVTSVTPADGAADVAYEPPAPVTIAFSEPMDPATVDRRTVVVRDSRGPVPGTVALDAAGTTATFTPDGPWREGRAYEVELAVACADVSGIPLRAPVHAGFTTARDAPVLEALAPTGPVAIDGYVAAFQASEALDPATVQPWNFAIVPPVPATFAWVPETRRIEVRFPETLRSSVAYAITAGTGIADDDGNRMAAPAVFGFTTAATPDNNAPGPIAGLGAASLRRAALRFAWTAPGDDVAAGVAQGIATAYELRRSHDPIRSLADFEAGAPVAVTMPPPGPAGAPQAVEVPVGLYEPWHYAVLAVDEAGNRSLSPDVLASVALADTRVAGATADGDLGAALVVADLDGDGHPELIAGEPGAARVRIYAGTADGPALGAPAATLSGPAGSRFGAALAAGDVDRDGDLDLLVGAPAEDGERGAAYLFATVDGLPEATAGAVFRGTVVRDRLGEAVAVADLDGDRVAEAIVGVPGGGAANEGLVLVAAGAGPIQPPLLFAAGADTGYAGQKDMDPRAEGRDVGLLPDPLLATTIAGTEAGEAFGSALAAADLDGDRVPELVIGAPGADAAGVDAGRVVIRAWAGTRELQGTTAGERFGASIAVGDADGDGAPDLLVGAPLARGEDDEGFATPNAGAVYLYPGPVADGAAPAWSAVGVPAEGRLGAAVAIAGPLLDGMAGGLVAGAPEAPDPGSVRHGTVHLFHVAADRTVTANGVVAGPDAFDGFGACVVPAGDLDGDGLDDLAIGAPFADGAASAAGRVHLLR
jgi:hypothetical protein